jgi:polyhydroxyalkanoate synthesis regulator phasin
VARLRAVRDAPRVASLESLARILSRGAQGVGEGVRAEARRVLDVLVERGDLSRGEAQELEDRIAEAADEHRRWLGERVLGPLGRAFGAVNGRGDLDARLAALEERLARIEAALRGRSGG